MSISSLSSSSFTSLNLLPNPNAHGNPINLSSFLIPSYKTPIFRPLSFPRLPSRAQQIVASSFEAGVGVMRTKLGMMTYFEPSGDVVPITVVGSREGNIVTQVKTEATDGYSAVQVGYRRIQDRKLTTPEMRRLEKSGIIPLRYLQEFRLQSVEGFEANQGLIFDEIFKEGDLVDVSGTTIGKGFQGLVGLAILCLMVGLIGLGRIYLGMHSLIDIIGGLVFGLAILAIWLSVHEYIDSFIVSRQNAATFWTVLSFLLLYAYPTPEFATPSFEFHTAFNGVALGIVIGIQQTYHQFHHENVPRIFTSELALPAFVGRVLVGIPTILIVKFCSKALAKWVLPILANILGIPIKSTSYIPALSVSAMSKKSEETTQAGYLQKLFFFSHQDTFDVDTGIRFLQYAGLAWSVVDLVPYVFSLLSL